MGSTGNKTIDDVAQQAVNTLFPGVSYNLKSGQAQEGGYVHAGDETLGQVTGRNIAREAANKQQQAIDDAKAQAAIDLKNQQNQKQESDIQASFAARGLLPSQSTQNPGLFAPNIFTGQTLGGGDKQTFLGV